MKKLLTIVVPSYNVEKFLDQTLRSFIDERIMCDLEVLIVDDGSKDKTAEIGLKYADRFPNTFRVISKRNGGHGSTINCGIREAKGKYFKVVDGDDWVITEGLVKLIEQLKNCEADYVFTDYYNVNDITNEKVEVRSSGLPVNQEVAFSKVAENVRISMHALAIKTEVLRRNRVCLDEHSFYVDVEYILYPIPYINSVIYYNIFVYMYRTAQMEQSASIKGYQNHMMDHIHVIIHILNYIQAYKSKKESEKEKIYYMEKQTAAMVENQVSIFSSFPLYEKGIRKQFKDFDGLIKKKNLSVYQLAGEHSGMLRILRMTKFHGYSLIVILSRLRNRKRQ